MKRFSIRFQIVMIVVVATMMAVLCSMFLFSSYDLSQFRAKLVRNASSESTFLAQNSSAALSFSDSKAATDVLSAIRIRPEVQTATLYDNKGAVFAQYRKDHTISAINSNFSAIEGSTIVGDELIAAAPVAAAGEKIGKLVIISDLKELTDRKSRYLVIGAIVTLFALGIAIFIASLLQRIVSAPIVKLSKAMKDVSVNGDYGVNIVHKEVNEMGTLMTGFNRMISEIHIRDNELRSANVELELSQGQLAEFFDNAPFGLNRISPEGIVIEANHVCLDIFGLPSNHFVGLPYASFFGNHEGIQAALSLVSVGQSVDNIDLPLKTSGGTEKIVRLNANGHWVDSHLVHIRCFVQDITALHQIEVARLDQERAERANLAKSAFLSRMSHELRTPMNAILGFGQLLEMQTLPELQQEWVDQIMKGGRHLLSLINDVLNISKIESGIMSISTEPVELRPIIEDAIKMVMPLASQRNVTFSFDSSSLTGLHAMADLQKLSQVLINVFSNAVKYNVIGGNVLVEVCEESIDRVSISITDSGNGIAPEFIPRLFTPFDRLGAEGSETEGTGLGLSHSKCLAEAMGGCLYYDSTFSGPGSRFILETAIAEVNCSEHILFDSSNGDNVGNRTSRIVLIEDNSSNQRVIEFALADHLNLELFVAKTGLGGLDLIEHLRPDMVLLDHHLPDIEGLEVAKILRQNSSFKTLPIIVLTADQSVATRRNYANFNIQTFLTKPVDLNVLLSSIDETLGRIDKSLAA